VECVEGRLQALRRIEPADESDRAALRFVEASLYPVWLSVREWWSRGPGRAGSRSEPRSRGGPGASRPRISDFTMRSRRRAAGSVLRLRTLRLGRPGQNRVRLLLPGGGAGSARRLRPVLDAVASLCEEPEWCRARVAVLQPVFRVKWCCIVLNEFVPSARRRRAFASAPRAVEQAKKTQLSKARRILAESGLQEETPWLA